MSTRDRIAKLRAEFNAARGKGRWKAAQRALDELSRLEPAEARWPHQLGEMRRRSGDTVGAVAAFELATRLYAAEGFVARAVAMAKTLLTLDPSRRDVLESVDPSAAQARHREARPTAISAPSRVSVVHAAPTLGPADDEEEDEVRFFDVSDASVIELDLSELELIELEADPEPPVDRLALMPSFPLFSELPGERLRVLAQGSELVELPPGARVIGLGEPADSLYCVVEGTVRVDVPGMALRPELREGDVFGESCLLDAGARQADVFVGGGSLVALRVPREVLDRVVEGLPELDDVLFELLARRVLGNFLRTSPLFGAFSMADRRALARRFEVRRAAAGLDLLVEGKRSDGVYVLVQGELTVDAQTRGPGAIVGVTSLLSRAPATRTVSTSAECVLLRLPAAKLTAFVATFPPAFAHLADAAARERALVGEPLS